jgi:hypothetical protein
MVRGSRLFQKDPHAASIRNGHHFAGQDGFGIDALRGSGGQQNRQRE